MLLAWTFCKVQQLQQLLLGSWGSVFCLVAWNPIAFSGLTSHLTSRISVKTIPFEVCAAMGHRWPTLWRHDQRQQVSSAWLFTWRTRLGQMLINPRQVVRIWTAKSKNSAWNAATNRSNISSVDIRRLCREITKMKRMLGFVFFLFGFTTASRKDEHFMQTDVQWDPSLKASKFLRRFLRSCVPGCFLWGMASLLSHSRCKMSLDFNTKRIKKETTQGTLKKHSKHSESQWVGDEFRDEFDLQLWIGLVASSTAWRPVLPFGPSRQGSRRWWKILWLYVDISVWLRMFFVRIISWNHEQVLSSCALQMPLAECCTDSKDRNFGRLLGTLQIIA